MLFLLLLTSSASTCLQHSRNLGTALEWSPVYLTQTLKNHHWVIISGLGMFQALRGMYPSNTESAQFLHRIISPHGKTGKCLVALFHLNLFILGCAMIFSVSISLIWREGMIGINV